MIPTAAIFEFVDKRGWIHILCEHEWFNETTKRWYRTDQRSIARTFELFKAHAALPGFSGVLLDFDHASFNPAQPTVAAGWIVDVEKRQNGLWAKALFTPAGLKAVMDGHYRQCSIGFSETEYISQPEKKHPGAGRELLWRPVGLQHVSLTNSPVLKNLCFISMPVLGMKREGVPVLPATTLRGAVALLVSALAERIRSRPQPPTLNITNNFRQPSPLGRCLLFPDATYWSSQHRDASQMASRALTAVCHCEHAPGFPKGSQTRNGDAVIPDGAPSPSGNFDLSG